jgi:hypothetical protein
MDSGSTEAKLFTAAINVFVEPAKASEDRQYVDEPHLRKHRCKIQVQLLVELQIIQVKTVKSLDKLENRSTTWAAAHTH